MNFSYIFKRIVNLTKTPQQTWMEISEEKDTPLQELQRDFLLPLMLCVVLVHTFRLFLNAPEFTDLSSFLSYYLKGNVVALASVFVGFYLSLLAVLLLAKVDYVAGVQLESKGCFKLVLYSSSILWCIQMLTSLVDILFFLKFASLYVAYVVWVGIPYLLKNVTEEKQNVLAVVVFLLIYASPLLVEKLLTAVMSVG